MRVLLIGALVTSVALTAAFAQPARATKRSAFAQLQISARMTIPADVIDAAKIVALSVAPTGEIVLLDEGSAQVIVLSPSGKRLRTLGRKGNGPGEFQRLHAVGWLADTLAVSDRSSKNGGISLFDVQNGRFLKTVPGRVGYLHDLFNAGEQLFIALESHAALPVRDRFGGMHRAPSEWKYFRVAGSGVASLETGLRDSTQLRDGFECRAKNGTIEGFEETILTDHGRLRGMIPGPGLALASSRDSLLIQLRRAGGEPILIRVGDALAPMMTGARWDSLTAPYRAVESKYRGGLDCEPPVVKPKQDQLVRALNTDEKGRVWVEVTVENGEYVYVLSPEGKPIGYFALPSGDHTVPWFVRGNTIYQVTVDADGLQGVRTCTVRLLR